MRGRHRGLIPRTFAELGKSPLVQELVRRYGGTTASATAIEIALPFLVPVSDAAIGSHAEIRDYVRTDVSRLDPVQGNAKDCYLVSAMIALAWSRAGAMSRAGALVRARRCPGPSR